MWRLYIYYIMVGAGDAVLRLGVKVLALTEGVKHTFVVTRESRERERN